MFPPVLHAVQVLALTQVVQLSGHFIHAAELDPSSNQLSSHGHDASTRSL